MTVVKVGMLNQNQLVACDGCGTVALLRLIGGWRRWTSLDATLHHCATCVERNDLVRFGMVTGVRGGGLPG